ncbi:HAD family hydrolase [Luteolibacter sp. Populi]|uniref:HAD family hydrolase n=1 Tax=Luteolibacter sp. Populi TaxID=3230487 RepID=UPI003467BE66
MAFDLDDTLFDRRTALQRVLEHWRGAPLDDAEINEVLEHDGDGHAPRRDFHAWLAERFPATGGEAREVGKRFRHDLPRHIMPDPAVLETLELLKARGIPLALLSNGSAAFQMAKLRACGAAPFFGRERLLFSGTLGVAKPDRRCFEALADCLGLPAGEILFIGDNLERDIRGAQAAGMQCCQLIRPGRASENAEPVIHPLREVMRFLEIEVRR